MRVRENARKMRPTMAELLLLAALPGTVCNLAEARGILRTNLSKTARVCESKGWLTRDRRGRFVQLEITAAGSKALAEFRDVLGQ